MLRNVTILGAAPTDLHLADGVIAEVGRGLATGGAQVFDAAGLVALPGLVDLHTHLREPGREDAETVASGTLAAALGGFTAVHAMANTDPAADTAGVVEQVWRLGRDAGHCDVFPVGAVTVRRRGEQLAELGAMADSAARVRVFSDDGHCVDDAVLMRRALEYVKAFDGVVAQHAQEPRLTHAAQMNEGVVSARLGLTGWPAVAEESVIARDCLLAGHVGSRLHVCHVSTAGSVETWQTCSLEPTCPASRQSRAITDSSATAGQPVRPSRADTTPSFICAACVSRGSWACWATTPSKALTYSSARRMSTASSTQCPSSENTRTRAAESAIAPSSASCSPRRRTVTAPTGKTSQCPASRPSRHTCSTTPAVSAAGSVLAMACTAVKPPNAAASVPEATVSASSRPGSRRCVCRSTRPGRATS